MQCLGTCACVCYLLNKCKLLRFSTSFLKLKTSKSSSGNWCTFKKIGAWFSMAGEGYYQLYFNKRTIYLHGTMGFLFLDHSKSLHYIWFYFISNRLYTCISRTMRNIAISLQHREDIWDQFFFLHTFPILTHSN